MVIKKTNNNNELLDTIEVQFWDNVDEFVTRCRIVVEYESGQTKNGRIMPCIYGYLAGTIASDGVPIDVWVGSGEKVVTGIVTTVDLLKMDLETKLLIGCSKQEDEMIIEYHNCTNNQKGILIRR